MFLKNSQRVMAYRIKSVAALTGLTTSTLRAWERRYGLLSPTRTSGGYRLYTEDDVARLTRIKSLLDNGFKVSEAIALVEREAPALAPADASGASLDDIRGELTDALLTIDRPAASGVAGRLASVPFERRIDEILLPALSSVGEGWAEGWASVAQEHFASAFVREKLASMLAELDAGPAGGPEVVCAGLPGELHDIGLLAFGVHAALRGWRVTFLGADLPLDDLEAVLEQRRPQLLATALLCEQDAAACTETFRSLRAAAPTSTAVLVGGLGIPAGIDGTDQGVTAIRELRMALATPLMEPRPA